MELVFADGFLASALLSILMPVLLLCLLTIWYVHQVKRQPGEEPITLTAEEAQRRRAARDAVPAPGVSPSTGTPGSV
ncbi:MAG: hypothetical protein ACRDNJ_14940 [Solirubrobacteraceae bacterium]